MFLPWVTDKVAINYLQGQYFPCPQSCLNRFRYHTCKLYAIEISKVENTQAPTCGDNRQVVLVEPLSLLGLLPKPLCNLADSLVQALDFFDSCCMVELNLNRVGQLQSPLTTSPPEFVYGALPGALPHNDGFNAVVSNRLLSR